MRRFILLGSLTCFLIIAAPAIGAEPGTSRPPVPEELVEAWERFQRALQDWGGRLWDRVGSLGSREERPLITQMLSQKEALGLSPEQVRKLEQLRDGFQRQSIRVDADLKIVEMDIAALLESDPVEAAKVEQKIREGEKLRADIRIARIRAIEQAKAVLNAEQKKKLQELTAQARPPRAARSGQNPSAKE
ncbi:MAG TPA: periplasmic heavy metal sensor [Candidatus Limnocylindria bacterium]|nr:periplasmic heavy metal sensor [Candidatus Limnocylindria bacterium]